MLRRSFYIFTAIMFCTSLATADHTHTHVGRNADGVWGTDDDNALWIFATPSLPQWETIEMLPTGEYIGDKQIYIAVLDCWHSAHPENGLYQLDFNDESTQPDWRIALKRISFSDSANFWMEDEATTLEILTSDSSTFSFGTPQWSDELPDGSGGLGAWHFHTHTEFLALADGAGQTFSATFTVIDTGSTGFAESAQYTLNFVTVPEPTTLTLLGAGLISVLRFRRK